MESTQVASDHRDENRVVILHYHLFKNAGTSLDALLQKQFPGGWQTREFPPEPSANRRAVRSWMEHTPDAVCFSSHTALLPPPDITGATVIPVIFVRHPLDRIASAYTFERSQNESSFGATLARHTSLRGYVEARLALPGDRQCRNFHVARFKDAAPERGDSSDLDRAVKALTILPFVGVVERMDESIGRLRGMLSNAGLTNLENFQPMRRNASTGRPDSLTDRIQRLRHELGDESFAQLEAANSDDLRFYEAADQQYAR